MQLNQITEIIFLSCKDKKMILQPKGLFFNNLLVVLQNIFGRAHLVGEFKHRH